MTEIPKSMRAFVLHGHGGLDQLRFHADGPTPSPGVGEALIRVRACGLNNTDINTRTGWYSKAVREATSRGTYNGDLDKDGGWDGGIEFPRIQGGDAAGIVVRVGEGVDEALIGQRCPVDPIVRDWSDPASIEKTSYLGSARDGLSAKPGLGIIPDADACGEPVASCGA